MIDDSLKKDYLDPNGLTFLNLIEAIKNIDNLDIQDLTDVNNEFKKFIPDIDSINILLSNEMLTEIQEIHLSDPNPCV